MRTPVFAITVAVALSAGAAAAQSWPAVWTVVTDGPSVRLELAIDAAGNVSGTIAGDAVEGFVAGDRLVMTRATGDRVEVWAALRGDTADADEPFLAGTVDSEGRLAPWYAVPIAGGGETPPPPAARRTPPQRTAMIRPVPTPEPPGSEGVAGDAISLSERGTVAEPQTDAAPDELSLAGRWKTPTGVVTVRQDGRRIEVVDGYGDVKSGRMTGETAFVVGLRTACCRGELTGPGMIKWDDGTVWLRSDD